MHIVDVGVKFGIFVSALGVVILALIAVLLVVLAVFMPGHLAIVNYGALGFASAVSILLLIVGGFICDL
nr:MAG TPA: hypothetical protein [Siphoviridae sp. ctcOR4]